MQFYGFKGGGWRGHCDSLINIRSKITAVYEMAGRGPAVNSETNIESPRLAVLKIFANEIKIDTNFLPI